MAFTTALTTFIVSTEARNAVERKVAAKQATKAGPTRTSIDKLPRMG